MKHQQIEDISNLYNSIYEEKSEEQLIAEFAADYFCEYGLNQDGIDILIEDVGLDNFIEFVYALSEDCEHLVEARSARRRSGGKSYEEVKAEIDAKEAAKAKAKARKKEESESESESETRSADTEAKEKQSKKRPVRDSIAKHILRGMERHNRAMDLAKKTIATAKKAASVAAEGERRAAHHIRKHGLKSLANEEAIISRFRQNIEEQQIRTVLAPLDGVAGAVKVKQTKSKTPGFLGTGIGSKTVTKSEPIPGTWTRETPGRKEIGPRSFDADGEGSRGAEAEMRDRSGPTDAERARFNAELTRKHTHQDTHTLFPSKEVSPSPRAVNQRAKAVGHSGYMPTRGGARHGWKNNTIGYEKPNQSWRNW